MRKMGGKRNTTNVKLLLPGEQVGLPEPAAPGGRGGLPGLGRALRHLPGRGRLLRDVARIRGLI